MATRRGTARNDRQTGTAANDTLYGLAGDDVLRGLAGKDLLDGGDGADLMQGGAGNDIYVVDNSKDRVIEKKGGGLDVVRASISYQLPAEVEDLVLLGNAKLRGDGNAGNNRLTGNGAANLLVGNAGDDILNGAGGADTLRGGTGDDTYVVDSAAARVIESANAGIDLLKTSVSFTLPAHVENLAITGNLFVHAIGNQLGNRMQGSAAVNVLDGGGGDDWLDGGAGGDTLNGGAGDDTFVVDHVDDTVIELAEPGIDTVRTALDGYVLPPHVERLVLLGGGNLTATGNQFDNEILGNPGNNSLAGGDGDDRLVGGGGQDTLSGGPGDDVYVVDSSDDVVQEDAPFTLLSFGFQDVADPTVFTNPGATGVANAIVGVSAWEVAGTGTLDPLQGFGPADQRGRAIGVTGMGAATPGGFQFTLTVAAGERIDLTAFAFKEQSSNGSRGQGPTDWTLLIANQTVASGAATLGNPGGAHAGELHLAGLTGQVSITLTATGALASTATWRVDDFSLTGTVGGGGDDRVEASVSYTLSAGVEDLLLTGADAIDGTGNALANHLTGNAGANLLGGAGGADTLRGGEGNDILVYDATDLLADGGTGFDTLRVAGAGLSLDLTALAGARLANLDAIDLRGSGANSLTLALGDLFALSADGFTLRVLGDADDALHSTLQGWQPSGDAFELDGRSVQSYLATFGDTDLRLLVDTALAASLS
ncbi:MAG: calcium-binding protein [Gammaproteobacteria bacterium]|nr:calcium-binding protein [Gammaproteobacteria bacterium]